MFNFFLHTSPIRRHKCLLMMKAFIASAIVLPFSLSAEVTVEYEVIARTGETLMPGTNVPFDGFGSVPSVDQQGNVVFIGGGADRSGVYTAINGVCCQRVADTTTAVPGGGGDTFTSFNGAERPDIDNGRVAFKARNGAFQTGLYSSVGQASASSLAEVAVVDGLDWNELGDPWVDGNTVAVYGKFPDSTRAILLWNGATGGEGYVDPGLDYRVAANSQASISGSAAILGRLKAGAYEMVIANGGSIETLATANVTLMPGTNAKFAKFYNYPSVSRNGQDAVFKGAGSNMQGVFKRVNGGALQNVVDTATVIPGSVGDLVTYIADSGIAMANGQVVFAAAGQYDQTGVYTDLGGQLSVLFDDWLNPIEVGGEALELYGFNFGAASFAYTPTGYVLVVGVNLLNGDSAIIRATIDDGTGPGNDSFTVYKDYSDNNSDAVSITLSCTSGTVTYNPLWAREGEPAVFTIENASPSATCTATETSVAAGYTKNESGCQSRPLNSNCTIVNTKDDVGGPTSGTFTVYQDFTDNSGGSTSVSAYCSSGTVRQTALLATEASPAVFTVDNALAGTTCTAHQNWGPPGYTANETDCQNGDPLNGSCTIINSSPNSSSHTFTVYKDFSDNSSASVSITASCSSGTVTNNPQLAREGAPAVFNISGASAGATCTATEPTVPAGYTRNQTDCQNGDPLNGSCTIVNTKQTTSTASLTVNKDFSDNSTQTVTFALSCSSGSVTNSPQTATESSPAVFTITGASAGATCTATEPSVPTGYTKNESGCVNRSLNSSCTIVNTKNPTSQPVDILRSNFESGTADGWSTGADVSVEAGVAVGQYALQLRDDTATSVRSVSTAGYGGVSISMRLAAEGLQKSDTCYAEYSINGGSNWYTLVVVGDGSDTGSFVTGSASPSSASNNSNLRLRFRVSGKGKGDYCYGDEIVVRGTPL